LEDNRGLAVPAKAPERYETMSTYVTLDEIEAAAAWRT
jgi:hypothetical protein